MTPGPWRIGNHGAIVCDCPPDCKHGNRDEEQVYEGHIICEFATDGNAHLIAAAPELLEACKRALPYLADHIGLTLKEGPGDRCAYDLMEAAIAKAEGWETRETTEGQS